ncbi:MAG: 2-oxo acid dehydrogenase subunit E2 [Eubacteriales bacterium]
MTDKKRRRGDRWDGYLVRDLDEMHTISPYVLPNRADNEAVLNETFDMTALKAYLAEKNKDNPEFKYTFFHVICAAVAKTLLLRPKMNRFYAGHRLYDRKDITLTFVVKKQFADDGEEALAILKVDTDSDRSPLEQVRTKIRDIVYDVRQKGETDSTTNKMGAFLKCPRFVLRLVFRLLKWLDYHGRYPRSLMKDDPYFCSVFLSNLGSIQMNANYHHLTNWGTNSFFLVIGELKPTPFFEPDGSYQMRPALELGMTIDERIADGLYFARSLRLLRKLLQNPSLLEENIHTPVE